MTVEQLIEVLVRLPGHARVVVDGYEGGYDDPVLDADRVAPRDDPEATWLGDLRSCGRDEDGEVVVVIGRGADNWRFEPRGEEVAVLDAIHGRAA